MKIIPDFLELCQKTRNYLVKVSSTNTVV